MNFYHTEVVNVKEEEEEKKFGTMTTPDSTTTTNRIPWYDYSRGGLLDPMAVKPSATIQPASKGCVCSEVVEDSRLLYGPEDNDGLLLSSGSSNKNDNNDENNSSNDEEEEENGHNVKNKSSSLLANHKFKNNKVLVVLNPFAGKGRGKKVIWPKLESALQSQKIEYELFETKHPGHATEYCRQSTTLTTNNTDAILVIGGDGTVNEVANGLLTRPENDDTVTPPIGILPGGTGNSTSVALKMDDPQIAIDTCLKNPSYIKFDIAKCTYGSTTRYILQLFGWGLGVDANIRAEKMVRFIVTKREAFSVEIVLLTSNSSVLRHFPHFNTLTNFKSFFFFFSVGWDPPDTILLPYWRSLVVRNGICM